MAPLGLDRSEASEYCHGEKQDPWALPREGEEASHGSGLVLVSAFLFPKVRINGPFLYLGGWQADC